jgi:hypothetical protein
MENESNNKQSSIEWLEEVYLNTGIDRRFHFEVAKAMHKEEIENAYADGVDDEYEYHINDEPRKNTAEYYLKKYGKRFINLVSDEESKVHEVVRKLKEKRIK